MLDELIALERLTYVPPTAIAIVYIGLGEHEEALHWLEKGFEERDGDMVLMKTWPVLDPLRREPRFQALLEGLRFPD